MKYWIESTWEEWVPFPQTIADFHAYGKARAVSEHIQEKVTEAVAKNLFSMDPHPEDYLRRHFDKTTSLGFYQTDKVKAKEWVDWRQQNLSPGQIQCILVEFPEPGDDQSLRVYGYGEIEP